MFASVPVAVILFFTEMMSLAPYINLFHRLLRQAWKVAEAGFFTPPLPDLVQAPQFHGAGGEGGSDILIL